MARAAAFATAVVGVACSRTPKQPAAVQTPPPADDAAQTASDSLEFQKAIPVVPPHDSSLAVVKARPPLSPLADSIGQYLVFAPSIETWFLAAGREKRLLVDLGRVDADVRTDAKRRAAYREAVTALSSVPIGTLLRIRGSWGAEDVTVSGFDSWNGRIVATVKGSPVLDSIVTKSRSARVPVVASAQRTDSVGPPVRDTCMRDSVPSELLDRASFVRDSLEQALRDRELPPYERLVNTLHATSTQVIGCFGGAQRLALVVNLRAGANEWIRERAVLLDTAGAVTALRVDDYRFKGHDFLAALDADGNGTDDIAARGLTDFAGGTVILSLTPDNRLQRLASGFAWESR